MSVDKLLAAVSRLFFVGAFILLVIATAEKLANLFDYTILRGSYTGGRILEFAAVLLIFVIAVTLGQLRDAQKR